MIGHMKNQEQNKKIPMHGDSIIKRMVFREAREASSSLAIANPWT